VTSIPDANNQSKQSMFFIVPRKPNQKEEEETNRHQTLVSLRKQ
jgi:hypothetical protein